MEFTVPFISDPEYVRFLAGLGRRIHAVYYSLYDPALNDARIRLRTEQTESLIDRLKSLAGPGKYLLANGRFHQPDGYVEKYGLNYLLKRIEQLKTAGVLDGIIFSDAYLLLALSDAAPGLASQIEAVPSVNFMIDTAPKLEAILDIIGQSRFRAPGKITLDRSLNRLPKAFSKLSVFVRNHCPGTKVELLVNEGCLDRCPYRPTHEALIAAANITPGFDTLRLNRDLGCMRLLNQSPHRILASPFIRPEDIRRFESDADLAKISGRTLGRPFLERAIVAYIDKAYHGNLLVLLDSAHWMAEQWMLDNRGLPDDFFDQVTSCDQLCRNCPGCPDLWQQWARPLPFCMKDLHPSVM